jgi:hypothetical protein
MPAPDTVLKAARRLLHVYSGVDGGDDDESINDAFDMLATAVAVQPAAPARTELTVLVHDDGSIKRVIEEPAAPSLGHPGTDEVFDRLQARRAEQRVLDAMSNINTAILQEHIQTSQGPAMAAFKAELARREVTSGDQ